MTYCPPPAPPAVSFDGDYPPTLDFELICADGLPAFRREIIDASGTSIVTFIGTDGAAITPTTWAPGSCGDAVTERVIREVYRLDWAEDGITATATTNDTGVPAIGNIGDRVVIAPTGVISIAWVWLPETAPVDDPLSVDPLDILLPVLEVDGMANVAQLPEDWPIFGPSATTSFSVENVGPEVGDYHQFIAYNGAHVEVSVLRKVII